MDPGRPRAGPGSISNLLGRRQLLGGGAAEGPLQLAGQGGAPRWSVHRAGAAHPLPALQDELRLAGPGERRGGVEGGAQPLEQPARLSSVAAPGEARETGRVVARLGRREAQAAAELQITRDERELVRPV